MKELLLAGILVLLTIACKNEARTTEKQGDSVTETTKVDTVSKVDSETLLTTDNIELSCPTGIFGIDISDNDDIPNWGEVGGSGISFIFIKATDGISFPTEVFEEQWRKIDSTNQKIIRGAYHFFEYTKADRQGQAQFYIRTVLPKYKAAKNTLPPVVDLEYRMDGKGNPIPVSDVAIFQQDVLNWLQAVETAFGRKPMVYTNINFANTNLANPAFAEYPLWIANYTKKGSPDIPSAWKGKDWVFWQKSESYVLKGISELVDFNCFNGTLEELKRM